VIAGSAISERPLSGLERLAEVTAKASRGDDKDQPRSPEWLQEFQLEGEELTPELIEEQLVPKARSRVDRKTADVSDDGAPWLNRVVVRDGRFPRDFVFEPLPRQVKS